jgi:hypothetical protein
MAIATKFKFRGDGIFYGSQRNSVAAESYCVGFRGNLRCPQRLTLTPSNSTRGSSLDPAISNRLAQSSKDPLQHTLYPATRSQQFQFLPLSTHFQLVVT